MMTHSSTYLSEQLADDLLQQIIAATEDFPAPPTVLTRILELTSDPATSVESVAEVLAGEPSIAARVLRQSNSAFYGRSRKIASLRDAVVMLGFHTVRSMVVATTAHSLYHSSSIANDLRQRMWEHSLATAVFSRILARTKRVANPEEAYIAGLLHDVGKLVLFDRFPDQMLAFVQPDQADASTLLADESKVFGFTHPMVGAILIDRWLFPEQLVEPVAKHHFAPTLKSISGTVALANIFVTRRGYNTHTVNFSEKDLLTEFGIDAEAKTFDEAFAEQRRIFEVN